MSPTEIIREVARITDIPEAMILGKKRTTAIVWAKLIATREIKRQFPHWSLNDLSSVFGDLRHSTILHRLRQAEWLFATKPSFRRLAESLHYLPSPQPTNDDDK